MSELAHPEVFKAYDVRGLFGVELDPGAARAIGRSFARVIAGMEGKPPSELRLGLGRDMRLTAPEMAEAYRAGMVDEGAAVLDAGMVGTEMLYFLVGSRDLDGGLMCTASHNPKPYTGAKLVSRGALALSGDAGLGEVRDGILGGLGDAPGGGSVEEVDVYDEFQQAALKLIDQSAIRPLTVVVDGGNGMAGPMVGPLLERLGLNLSEAYWTPDGNFPDHEPNPMLPENREFVMREVVERKADLGIAWDGDADRCFFIDEQGQFVDGDFLTALLTESLLRKEAGATVLYDVRASRAVADVAKRAGGRALVNRVGHAFFKTRMREEHAIFGGEVSGHYYFREFYNADSGTLPALLILELLSERGAPMSELLEPYRSRYFISGEINSTVEDGDAKMEALAERYSDAKQSRLDGISVDYEDWHFNVRASNTEPLLRLCLESLVSVQDMEAKRDEVLGLIRVVSSGDAGAPDLAAEAERLVAEAGDAGIHLMAVPTPFLVGRVNCYLIEDDPLTLVDTGPNSGKSLDELEQAISDLGHRIEDLGLIVITHQHMDHLGLLEIIARRSGADVAAFHLLDPYLEDFSASATADDAFSMNMMRRHGVPAELATALGSVGAAFRAFGSSGHVTVPLRDGDEITLRDRTLTARHRPGHSPSDTVFWDERRQILVAGDHLLARISSNPLLSRPLDGGASDDLAERPHALVDYMSSLRRTREMPAQLVLGGHGPPIRDHAALIDERFRMSERRAGKVRRLLESGPQTAYDLATQMWGNVAVTQAYLTISEVLGHLDLLIADGRAAEDATGPVTRFAAGAP